jgi:hypothetical protein
LRRQHVFRQGNRKFELNVVGGFLNNHFKRVAIDIQFDDIFFNFKQLNERKDKVFIAYISLVSTEALRDFCDKLFFRLESMRIATKKAFSCSSVVVLCIFIPVKK